MELLRSSARRRPRVTVAAQVTSLLLASLAVPGCAEESVPLTVSWQLGEGQACDVAGVAEVEVAVTSALRASSRFDCDEGLAPREVALGTFTPGIVRIEVVALSADEAVLFRAESLSDLRGETAQARMRLDRVEGGESE